MVGYANDPAGRLGYAPAAGVSGIGYAAHNGLMTETYGNSLIHAISYNNRLQPNEIRLGTSGAPTSVVSLTYNYRTTNNNGNVNSLTYSGVGLSYTQTFGYDQMILIPIGLIRPHGCGAAVAQKPLRPLTQFC